MAKNKKIVTKDLNGRRKRYLFYWGAHPNFSALVHTALGMGLGVLAQGYVEAGYINSVGYLLVLLGLLAHLYVMFK